MPEERPEPAAWRLEPFEADDGTVPYQRFIAKLSDFKFVALDGAMTRVLAVRSRPSSHGVAQGVRRGAS